MACLLSPAQGGVTLQSLSCIKWDPFLERELEDLINYKRTHRSRPIRGVAVVITAWDRLKPVADKIGFDILNPIVGQEDLYNFVRACFPAVHAAIKSLRIPNVAYFPSFFETETNEDDTEKRWPDDTPIIKQRRSELGNPDEWWRDLRKINYSEGPYVRFIGWLKQLAYTV